MELVKELSQKAMPLLSNDLMDSLMARLEAIGVNGVEDLNFVRIEDVDGILRPNQCRRLIQAFSGVQPARLDPTLTTLPQNDHQPQTPPETPGPMECSPPCEAYAVPWHKMPPNLMLALREKKRPKPKERRELVRILIDDVLCNSHIRPGRAKLREIAKQIVQQYPCSFQDRELSGTKIIGTGYDSLFIQLENRVDNVRRPLTVCSARRPIEEEDTVRKKPMQSDSYGCVAWRPVVEDTTELESKQDELKRAFHTNHLQESSVLKLMAETYCIQRATINKGTSINKIVDEWPLLFEAVHLFDHTEKLLGFPVQTRLSDELTRKEKAIKEFLDLKGIEMHEGPLPLVAGIAKFFKENPDHLLYQNEISRSPGVSIPCTPCILVMGDQLFKIAVDQEIVNDHISSPIVALAYAFALFYVLNIKYPKEMSLTLEFIQRVFLGINPERGSKAEMKGKKQPHIPPRLLKFLTELNNFENPWKI